MPERRKQEQAELDFYREELAPWLPEKILDFHAHTWVARDWQSRPWESESAGGKYMVTTEDYPPVTLLADGQRCFPDREYHAVCFGYPTPVVDWEKDTAFVAAAGKNNNLWPLVLGGCELGVSRERYEDALEQGGFYGFKVFLNWLGDQYGDKRVEEMLGPVEIELANERHLVITLHVPRSGRLADPVIQEGVAWLAKAAPDAAIVLAHCGRCYLPGEMMKAVDFLRNLPNVSLDASMVMDVTTLQLVLNAVGPERLLYATDFPVAAMRGRRVRVMDHWVDVVLPGYPESAFRVAGDIHAVFMAWEIALAIRWAVELTGLGQKAIDQIFWENGRRLLQRVQVGPRS